MNQNWIVENLNNAFSTWNGKLTELWGLVTTSPQSFKGGAVWGVMQISDRIRVIYFYGIPVIIRFLNFFLSKLIRICTVIHLVADDIAAHLVQYFVGNLFVIVVLERVLHRIEESNAVLLAEIAAVVRLIAHDVVHQELQCPATVQITTGAFHVQQRCLCNIIAVTAAHQSAISAVHRKTVQIRHLIGMEECESTLNHNSSCQ